MMPNRANLLTVHSSISVVMPTVVTDTSQLITSHTKERRPSQNTNHQLLPSRSLVSSLMWTTVSLAAHSALTLFMMRERRPRPNFTSKLTIKIPLFLLNGVEWVVKHTKSHVMHSPRTLSSIARPVWARLNSSSKKVVIFLANNKQDKTLSSNTTHSTPIPIDAVH